MQIEFKFPIGAYVTTKAMKFLSENTCQAFTVVERYVQECQGGIQLHYRLRTTEPPREWSGPVCQSTHWPGEAAILTQCLPEGELCEFPEASKAIYGGHAAVRQKRVEEAKTKEAT